MRRHLSTSSPIPLASSFSVGARPSFIDKSRVTASIRFRRLRMSREAQSSSRWLSRIAPLIRYLAYA
jgi:hypothetical protein